MILMRRKFFQYAVIAVMAIIVYFVIIILSDYKTVGEYTYETALVSVGEGNITPDYKTSFGTTSYSYNAQNRSSQETISIPQTSVSLGSVVNQSQAASLFSVNYSANGIVGAEMIDSQVQSCIANMQNEYREKMLQAIYVSLGNNDYPHIESLNTTNFVLAFLANIESEGKPGMSEGINKMSNAGVPFQIVQQASIFIGGKEILKKCTRYGAEHYYITSNEHVRNLYSLGSSNKFFTSYQGLGIVQWSAGRCWSYVEFLNSKLQSSTLDVSDVDVLLQLEVEFALKEVERYMVNNDYPNSVASLYGNDPKQVSLQNITAWLAGVYECPANCVPYRFGSSQRDKTLSVNTLGVNLTRGNQFYKTTLCDAINLNTEMKWSTSPYSGDKTVTECTRIKRALQFYNTFTGGSH